MKLAQDYLKHGKNFKQKWIEYNSRTDLKLNPDAHEDTLTPFFSMGVFDTLTNEEKTASYLKYIQFIAETQVFLEKILVFGFYKFRKSEAGLDKEILDSMRLLSNEELFHTAGYEAFLAQNFKTHLFVKNSFFRKAACFCLTVNPLAITLIGAKFEAVSAPYYAELRETIKDSKHPWLHLNKIHMQDEVFHVPLQFDIYNASVQKFGFRKTVFTMFFLYLVFQMVLLLGMKKIVDESFTKRNVFVRNFILLPKLIFWASRRMPSFQQSRSHMRKQFKLKAPRYRRALKFIYT